MIEIKACTELLDVHFAQAINYLEASQFEIGLLINFGSEKLQIKRLYNNKNQGRKELRDNRITYGRTGIEEFNGTSLPTILPTF